MVIAVFGNFGKGDLTQYMTYTNSWFDDKLFLCES